MKNFINKIWAFLVELNARRSELAAQKAKYRGY